MDSVASRYAIALLTIAREENKIKEYCDEVSKISEILTINKDLLYLLKSYGLSTDEKKDTIKTIFEGKISQFILNLFYVLIDNKRGGYLLATCEEFVRISLNELNIKSGVVYTTIKLTSIQIKALEMKVSSILNANVTLVNKLDESLLGGFKIQVEDYILDDSIKNRLANLKQTIILKKGENDYWILKQMKLVPLLKNKLIDIKIN